MKKLKVSEHVVRVLIYAYLCFGLLNIIHLLICKEEGIIVISNSLNMLIIDAVLLVSMIVFLIVEYKNIGLSYRFNKPKYAYIFFFALAITFSIIWFFEYRAWRNVNAGIYNAFSPKYVVPIFLLSLPFIFLVKLPSKEQISISVCLVLTVYIVPFLETFAGNIDEFGFGISNVVIPMVCFIIAASVVLSFLQAILSFGESGLLSVFIWTISICAYIQGAFLNSKLFLMDGKEMNWPLGTVISNILIWIAISVILTILVTKIGRKYLKQILLYSSLFLIAIQLIGVISLIPKFSSEGASEESVDYLSEEGITSVARDENVIVFVLDTYDVDFMNEVLEVKPDFLGPLKDFTYYPDTMSQFSRTFPSVPYILSHELYFYEIPKQEYADEAFDKCAFWDELDAKGIKYYLYEDDKTCIGRGVAKRAGNHVDKGEVLSLKTSFLKSIEAIMTIGGYRQLPYAVKSELTYTSDTIDSLVIKEKIWDKTPYDMNDIRTTDEFRKTGLSVDTDEKAFRFIHLMGAHAPYIVDEEGKDASNRVVDPVEQYIGSMQYVFEYLEELKRLGLYDNATIIITADHGENFVAEELPENTNPILFIKAKGNSGTEVKISDSFASLEDIMPTVAGAFGIDYDDGVGVDLLDADAVKMTKRERNHYFAVVQNTIQTGALRYRVDESSLDFDNWINTGEYHEFGEYYE